MLLTSTSNQESSIIWCLTYKHKGEDASELKAAAVILSARKDDLIKREKWFAAFSPTFSLQSTTNATYTRKQGFIV